MGGENVIGLAQGRTLVQVQFFELSHLLVAKRVVDDGQGQVQHKVERQKQVEEEEEEGPPRAC